MFAFRLRAKIFACQALNALVKSITGQKQQTEK